MCDHAIVLADGKVLAEGAPAKVLTTYRRRLVDDDRRRDEPHPEGEGAADTGDVRIWGDRRAEIRATRMVGPDGPATSFVSGDPLIVEMEVAPVEPLEGVNLRPDRALGRGACSASAPTRASTGGTPASWRRPPRCSFHIPALHLHAGRFTVHAGGLARTTRCATGSTAGWSSTSSRAAREWGRWT